MELFEGLGWLEGTEEVEGEYVEDVLEEKNMDWTTSLKPIGYYVDEGMNLSLAPTRVIPNFFANVRSTDGKSMGVVGNRYMPVQNFEAFGVLNVLVAAGEMEIVRAQSIRDGRKIMLVSTRPEKMRIAGELYSRYTAWVNSHDGHSPVVMVPVPTRDFCTNVMRFKVGMRKDAYKIRHTRYAPARLLEAQTEQFGVNNMDVELNDILGNSRKELEDEAHRALALDEEYASRVAKTGNDLANVKFSDRDFEEFLKKLVPQPEPITNAEGRVTNQRGITIAENKQWGIRSIYKSEENLNDIRGTKWGAFQATVQYTDHSFPYQSIDRKVEAILDGASLNQKALRLLS